MYHTNFIKATYHDLKFFFKKEKDRVYEILDLHEIDLIESTKIVMLQGVTKSTYKRPSISIVLKLSRMEQLAHAKLS